MEREHERQRLELLQLSLSERFFEARICRGRSAEVLEDLIRGCLANPLRETLWCLRIRAHAALGEQAEALRAFDEIRAALVETLGAEPGPDLQDVHQSVLGGALESRESDSGPVVALGPDLVGRTADLDVVDAALESADLVTLTGVGGVGKTSIAEFFAYQRRTKGLPVAYAELLPVRHRRDVVDVVARAAGVRRVVEGVDDVAAALGRRPETLVILDNCEHVVSVASELAEGLNQAGVRVLTTSRVPLGARGERIVHVGPLEDVEDAATLFVREATRHAETLSTDARVRAMIRAICDDVDRLPLALELVAARTRSVGLEELREHLTTVLGSSRLRSPDRHATMTATLPWSVDLLDPEVARCLGALTVSAGSFDLDAAAALIGVVSDLPVIDVMDELTTHSLVESTVVGVTRRYRLLEPIRQVARRNLVDDLAALRDTHLEHYLQRLEEAYASLGSLGDEALSGLVKHDLANLAAVHSWALESGRVHDDVRLYRPLMPYIFWHEVFAPSTWATETLAAHGHKLSGADRMLVSSARAESHREGSHVVDPTDMYSAAARAEDDQERELLLVAAAWIDTLLGNLERARSAWEEVDRGDPNANLLYWMVGSYSRVLGSDDIASAARADLEPGIAWARRVRARNFEAALREVRAEFECFYGDPRLGCELARTGEKLGRNAEMTFVTDHARLVRAVAGLRGADIEDEPVALLQDVLASARRGECASLARIAGTFAAPLLFSAGERDAAALADAHRVGEVIAPVHVLTGSEFDHDDGTEHAAPAPPALELFEALGEVEDALGRILSATTP